MMAKIMEVVAVVLVWMGSATLAILMMTSCSPTETVGPHAAAKQVQSSYNPYEGLTKEEYLAKFGTPEDAATLLGVMAERIAELMDNQEFRKELAECLNNEPGREANLSEILLSHPNLLKAVSSNFKLSIKDLNGDLPDYAGNQVSSDESSFLTVAQGLMGVRLHVKHHNDQKGPWNGDPIPVFFNPTTDEKDTEWVIGYEPGGEHSKRFRLHGLIPYTLLFVAQDEVFFQRPGNEPFSDEDSANLFSPAVPTSGTILSHLGILDLIFPQSAYAHNSNHTNVCFHETHIFLKEIRFYDIHEPQILGEPELYTRSRPTGSGWRWNNALLWDDKKGTYTIKRNNFWPDGQNEPTWFDRNNHDDLAKQILYHSGRTCPSNYYSLDTKLRVKERDTGPDDKVARWIFA